MRAPGLFYFFFTPPLDRPLVAWYYVPMPSDTLHFRARRAICPNKPFTFDVWKNGVVHHGRRRWATAERAQAEIEALTPYWVAKGFTVTSDLSGWSR